VAWEGNRRSGVALVMRHRLQWFMLGAHGLRKGDEHRAYMLTGYGILCLLLSSTAEPDAFCC